MLCLMHSAIQEANHGQPAIDGFGSGVELEGIYTQICGQQWS
jgi:hypothetical protein